LEIISIYNQKGGVGKTSLSALLGLYSSRINKTLLVDLDPQESLSQIANSNFDMTAYNMLSGQPVKDCIQTVNENLYMVRGDLNLIKIQNGIPINTISKVVKNLASYDIVIIDLPPTYNNLVVSSLTASNKILIPTLQSDFDLKSLLLSLEIVNDIGKDKKDVFICFNKQKTFTKDIEKRFLGKTEIKSYVSFCFPNSMAIRKDIAKMKLSEKVYKEVEKLYYSLGCVI
jgi:cellulose biosynthesis protein BcsQ